VRYVELTDEADLQFWLTEFLRLEATGWKGRQGTALAANARDRQFFYEVVRGAFERRRLMVLALEAGGRPLPSFAISWPAPAPLPSRWLSTRVMRAFRRVCSWNSRTFGVCMRGRRWHGWIRAWLLVPLPSSRNSGLTAAASLMSWWKRERLPGPLMSPCLPFMRCCGAGSATAGAGWAAKITRGISRDKAVRRQYGMRSSLIPAPSFAVTCKARENPWLQRQLRKNLVYQTRSENQGTLVIRHHRPKIPPMGTHRINQVHLCRRDRHIRQEMEADRHQAPACAVVIGAML